MGIKGRRKKMREREARQLENMQQMCGIDVGLCDESRMDGPLGSSSSSVAPHLNSLGELKIKKSELYKMQDYEYLDRVREEHEQRHRPPSSSRKRERSREDVQRKVEEVDATCLGHQYIRKDRVDSVLDTSFALDVFSSAAGDGSGGDSGRTRPIIRGPLFAHPLLGLDEITVKALEACGWTHMTRIQERTIPYALQGYDILGQAHTGSGKTLAFCVPILHSTVQRMSTSCSTTQTFALFLAPTKELCVQTEQVLQKLVKQIEQLSSRKSNSDEGRSCASHKKNTNIKLTVKLITGGTKAQEERRWLSAGTSLVVGTPGRVHDHACRNEKCWSLAALQYFVLDEADRMLADGFQRDLDAILSVLPKGRQTFLFSATNSKSVQALARLSLSRTPIMISTTGTAPEPVEVDTEINSMPLGSESISASISLPPYLYFPLEEEKESKNGDKKKKKSSTKLICGEKQSVSNGPKSENENPNSSASSRLSSRGGALEGKDDEASEEDYVEEDDEEEDSAAAIPSTLRQLCHIVRAEDRLVALYVFVKRIAKKSKGMIFCSTVASVTFHCQMLGSIGFHNEVMMLHGHMKHRQRLQAFQVFNEWKTGVMFCTDVAARGLDIPHVEWILQYDPPLDPTEYIHRIGRTARAGRVGNSLLFIAPEEVEFIPYLKRFGIHLEKYPMPLSLPDIKKKLEHVLQLDPIVAKSAVAAYRAHVGAYQSHILKETFDIHQMDLKKLATAFALTAAPAVTLPKNSVEEKKREYVKGKLKSLHRRRKEALRQYEEMKTKPQWDGDVFIGVTKPS